MKTLIALLALSISAFASADSIMIFETRDNMTHLSDVTSTFQINTELGRAWVNVSISEIVGDSTYYDDTRVKVEGLSMNEDRTAIVFEKDGLSAVCASVTSKRGVFRTNLVIRPTGECKLVAKEEKVQVDDGFNVYTVPMIRVYLNVE